MSHKTAAALTVTLWLLWLATIAITVAYWPLITVAIVVASWLGLRFLPKRVLDRSLYSFFRKEES